MSWFMLWFNIMGNVVFMSWFNVIVHLVVHVMVHCPQYSQIFSISPLLDSVMVITISDTIQLNIVVSISVT